MTSRIARRLLAMAFPHSDIALQPHTLVDASGRYDRGRSVFVVCLRFKINRL